MTSVAQAVFGSQGDLKWAVQAQQKGEGKMERLWKMQFAGTETKQQVQA